MGLARLPIALLLRSVAVLLGVQALWVLGTRAPQVQLPREAELRAARPDAWSVEVDGWHISIDGVAVRPLSHGPGGGPQVAEMAVETDHSRRYDSLIGKHAEAAGLDWRLVSALIVEESNFRPDSESRAGAYGLMQVRDIAAREVGETNYREPDANIRTGVRYLKRLEGLFAPSRGRDRKALMLAAYNMGPGHVRDAQRLARRFGYDPYVWDGSMAEMTRLLEQPQVYRALPHGYAQGSRVVAYVERVLDRYSANRRLMPSEPPHLAPALSDGP